MSKRAREDDIAPAPAAGMPADALDELMILMPRELLEEIARHVRDPEGLFVIGQTDLQHYGAALRALQRPDVLALMTTCFYHLIKRARDALVAAVAAGTFTGAHSLNELPAFVRLRDWRRMVRGLPPWRFIANPPEPAAHGLARVPLARFLQDDLAVPQDANITLAWLRTTAIPGIFRSAFAHRLSLLDTRPLCATFQTVWYSMTNEVAQRWKRTSLNGHDVYGWFEGDTVDWSVQKHMLARLLALWRDTDWAGCAVTLLTDPVLDAPNRIDEGCTGERAGLQALCVGLGIALADVNSALGIATHGPARFRTAGTERLGAFYRRGTLLPRRDIETERARARHLFEHDDPIVRALVHNFPPNDDDAASMLARDPIVRALGTPWSV